MRSTPTALTRLLEEVSWEGNATRYRGGGRGRENVLTTEVFQALDFLPRTEFLGRVLATASGAPDALGRLVAEVEEASISLLPGEIALGRREKTGSSLLDVQPDGIIESPSVFCILEAKRFKSSSFMPEQLARNVILAVKDAGDRTPLLLLVIPKDPPVAIQGKGRMSISEAVDRWLEPVLQRLGETYTPPADLRSRIEAAVAYTTWDKIQGCVAEAMSTWSSSIPSADRAVSGLAALVRDQVNWHR